jgi:hypothetical protein
MNQYMYDNMADPSLEVDGCDGCDGECDDGECTCGNPPHPTDVYLERMARYSRAVYNLLED